MRAAVWTTTLLLSLAACDAKKPDEPKPTGDTVTALSDDVDLDAAKQAFGCDAPKDASAKRACRALAAFEKGDTVRSYPSAGTDVFAALLDCAKPTTMVTVEFAGLLIGAPRGDVDEAHRAPGMIKIAFLAAMPDDGVGESLDRVIGQLRERKPRPELTPEESDSLVLPKEWSDWKLRWASHARDELHTVHSDGKSLLERSESGRSVSAYWREADGTLIRVAPRVPDLGLCVSHYYLLPQ